MYLLDGLLTLTVIHFIATASPGPEFMLISKDTLQHGRRAGFITLLGTLSGISVHLLYSAFGLATVISNSPNLLLMIQLAGGAYLIYLGISGLRAQPQVNTPGDQQSFVGAKTDWQRFRTGVICDVLNPKAPVYYVALFTFVLSPDMPATDIAIYGLWIMAIHFTWFSIVVMLLSTPAINRKFKQFGHWIDRVLGGAMVMIGFKVLIN